MTCAVSAFMVVDLPAPFGPSRPTQVPNGTSRSRPSTAVSGPNRLTKPRSCMADVIAIVRTLGPPAGPEVIGLNSRGLRVCRRHLAVHLGALRDPARHPDRDEDAVEAQPRRRGPRPWIAVWVLLANRLGERLVAVASRPPGFDPRRPVEHDRDLLAGLHVLADFDGRADALRHEVREP